MVRSGNRQVVAVTLRASIIRTTKTVSVVCWIGLALAAGITAAAPAQVGGQTIGLGIPAPQASENDLTIDGRSGPVVVFSCGASGATTFAVGASGAGRARCGLDLCVTAGNAGAGKLVVTLARPGNAPASLEISPGFYGTTCSANITQIDLSCEIETRCAVTDLRIDQALINRPRLRRLAAGRRGSIFVPVGPPRFPARVILTR